MNNRIISAIVIAASLIIFILLSGVPFVMNLTVALIAASALYEVLIVTKYIESKSLIVISIVFAFIIPFIPVIPFVPDFTRTAFTLGIFAFTMVLFITLLAAYETFSLEHLSVVFLMSIIIPFFFSTLIYSRQMDAGFYNLLYIFLCAWACDSGGYIFGRMFGRHKLTPKISPKKTVEGAFGGVAASIVTTICLCYIIDVFDANITVDYAVVVIYSLIGGIFAILGDLSASVIKRNFGVKDFGKLIPGHGGIMDRFDSVLFVAPMMYLSLYLYPVFIMI